MNGKTIRIGINQILDEWDPICVLQDYIPIDYSDDALGEYTSYVIPVIKVYLSNQSIYDYLVKLHIDMWTEPNEEMDKAIMLAEHKIMNFLSRYTAEDVRKAINQS
ncbi:MAG: hypothetical protein JST82_07015 [Bacteroidetes bacterium]|nr:hypothetical protein [Bacteroidota bacterium]